MQAAAKVHGRNIIPKEQPQENQDSESSDSRPGETSGAIVHNTESDDTKRRLDLLVEFGYEKGFENRS